MHVFFFFLQSALNDSAKLASRMIILFRSCLISQYLVPKMCDVVKKSLINQFQ